MEYKKITLRIPVELHKNLLELAKVSSKSMNAEIINRLQASTKKNQAISEERIKELMREVIREELSKNKN